MLGNPVSRTDGRGNTTSFTWNALGELVEERAPMPFGDRRRFIYDGNGNQTAVEVENTWMTIDGFTLPVRDEPWIRTAWSFDILDQVVEEARQVSIDPVGGPRRAVTRVRRDPNGNVARIIRAEGNEERWTWDDRDLPLERIAGGGTGLDPGAEAVERFDHDEDGNLLRITGPADVDGDGAREETWLRRDGFGRLLARTDPCGGTWVIQRDPEGNPLMESFLGSPGGALQAGPGGNVLLARVRRSFDARRREVRTEQARFGPGVPGGAAPRTEVRTFDRMGRLVRRVDPLGSVWTVERDGAGRPARTTDPAGNRVENTYDGAGNLAAVTRTGRSSAIADAEAGAAGEPGFDGQGHLLEVRRTVYVHDARNRLTARIENSGRTFRWRHDSRGNVIHESDAVGTVISAGLDPDLAEVLPLLSPVQADFSNGHGNQIHFEVDGLDRRTRVVHDLRKDGKGQLDLDHMNPFNDDGLIDERFEWDGNGRLAGWTDDRGNRRTVTYDRLDRPQARTDPDGKSESFDYDPAGNPIRWTSRSGTVVTQVFDACGRILRRTVEPPEGQAGPEGTRLQIFQFDGLGRPTLAFDGNDPADPADDQLVVRTYDSLGGLVLEQMGPFPVRFGNDAAGRPTEIISPDGRRIVLDRDGLGRLAAVREGFRTHGAFGYLGPEEILSRDYGNGIRQTYVGKDGQGRTAIDGLGPEGEVLREMYLDARGERVLAFEMGRDRAGRIAWERRLHDRGIGPALAYDSIGRLREIQPNLLDPRLPPATPLSFTRIYPDGAHNIGLTITDFTDTRSEADNLDRMVQVDGKPLLYDDDGNLVTAGDLEFRFDAFGRPVRVIREGITALRFAFDAVGAWDPLEFRGKGRLARRELLTPREGDPGGTFRTLFLDDLPLEERSGSGDLLRRYLHGPDGRLLEAIDVQGGSRPYFILQNGSGFVSGITDGQGALFVEVRKDLFGAPQILGGSGVPAKDAVLLGNIILRAAMGWETLPQLYSRDGRTYSSGLGRFVTPGGQALSAEPLGMSRYAVLDPLKFLGPRAPRIEADPLGISASPEAPRAPAPGLAIPAGAILQPFFE